MQQLVDLLHVEWVAEHRQSEGRFGDENITVAGLEGWAGRVRPALVIAGSDDPAAVAVDHHLRAAQHMAGRDEAHRDIADREGFPIAERLQRAAGQLPIAHSHDRDGVRRREHPLVAGASVITVAVGDDGARHRVQRIDVEVPGLAIEPRRSGPDPSLGPRRGNQHRRRRRSCQDPPI